MTARSKRYGEPGDHLRGPAGLVLELVRVERERLETIASDHWREEGCASPSEFRGVWKKIHPRAGWTPGRLVWLHEFTVVGEVGP